VSAWSSVWAVIRREYLERVRTRWFVLTTIGGPVLFMSLIFLPRLMGAEDGGATRRIAVVDRTGELAASVRDHLEEAGFTVEVAADENDETVAGLTRRSEEGDLGGVMVLDSATLSRGYATLSAKSRPSALRRLTMQGAVVQAALEAQLDAGSQAEALLRGGELEVTLLSGSGAADEADFIRVYIGAFLLYMVILFYAVSVMRSTLEEKTSRIVEVVISSMRPWHLMLGKILGVGAVGLTQLAVWVAFGLVMAILGLPALVAARPELAQLSELQQYLPGLGYLALFLVFFLHGYFIYAAMYAAVGAMVNSEQEAQQAQCPVVILLVAPAVLLVGVIQDPASTTSVVLSLVPFFSPVLMFARAAADAAPWWQVIASVILMALTVVGLAWLAGRIYKVGILMAGKRPTLPELWRWVRQA
jgi:ABC-2 type transport system permease protein